jgi:Tol biopolymer transport system component
MNADGSGLVQLTRDFGNNIHPAWSPAGDRIVFRHGRNDRSQFVADDLYTMWPDGSHLVQLTRTRTAAEGHADWQPAV